MPNDNPTPTSTEAGHVCSTAELCRPRFDRKTVVEMIAHERGELIDAKFAGKPFDADRLAELDDAITALCPRITDGHWQMLAQAQALLLMNQRPCDPEIEAIVAANLWDFLEED